MSSLTPITEVRYQNFRTFIQSEILAAASATAMKNLYTLFPPKDQEPTKMQKELFPRLDFFQLVLLSSLTIIYNMAIAIIFSILSICKLPYQESFIEGRHIYWIQTGIAIACMAASGMGTLIPKYGVIGVAAIDFFGLALDYQDIRSALPEEVAAYLPEGSFTLSSAISLVISHVKELGRNFFGASQPQGDPSEAAQPSFSVSSVLELLTLFRNNN